MKPPLIAVILFIMVAAAIGSGVTYLAEQSQIASLRSDTDELRMAVVSSQDEVSDLGRSLDAYHQITAHQEEIAHSLRLKLQGSIGDRLVMTEPIHEELPKTIAAAEALGYSLLDKVTSEGKLIEAACFAHEDTLHYAKRDPKITSESKWHGAPVLLLYSNSSKNLMGMVLESTSPQPSPPWEYHAHGHSGMEFAHSSLHIWFTDPPENLSLN